MLNTKRHDDFLDFADELANNEDVFNEVEKIKEKGDVKATLIIQEDKKTSLKNEFVILFLENFDRLITELNLTTTELRVLVFILKKMEYGNLINLNQAAVCSALNMKKSNVSLIFKKLKEKMVLIEDNEKNLYVNSNLVMKGLKHKLDKTRMKNLRTAQVETDHFDRSH
ncbi:MarR family transcriptional regulator [Escherichia coli]|nr:MarR family transcriptional regulator [Escherichia coli]EES7639284.1 MarR family transcriptional regulator [Escherichia coli]EET2854229.1 MarR family transcriptional regulator [Escherichia coli]EET3015072.1 MarR family transcriptional regulator [Escherichia coli]EET4309256.1 MarR family transcriptional regulator [Escherichia coli]